MGIPTDQIESAIRVSWGDQVKIDEVIHGFKNLLDVAKKLSLDIPGALKAPVRCFGNHLSGKRKSLFRTDDECGGAAILKKRISRMGTPVAVNDYSLSAGSNPYTSLIER